MTNAQKIMDSLDIKRALEYYGIHFNRRGYAVCPFHKEKTASFKTYNNRFKCFGCGESGSIIDFVMRAYGLNFKQAIVRIDHDFQLGIMGRDPIEGNLSGMCENRRIERAYREWQAKLWKDYKRWSEVFRAVNSEILKGNINDSEIIAWAEGLEMKLDTFNPDALRDWSYNGKRN